MLIIIDGFNVIVLQILATMTFLYADSQFELFTSLFKEKKGPELLNRIETPNITLTLIILWYSHYIHIQMWTPLVVTEWWCDENTPSILFHFLCK